MLVIIAALVSIAVQFLKQRVTSQWETLLILVALSLAGAGIYTALVDFGYWESVYGVLVTASAFYALVLARFEQTSEVPNA
jgi:hypothetical protein